MFNCAICKSEIEKDSFFCDQCGKEIFLCTECSQPGEGSFCEFDGSDMIAAKLKKADSQSQTPIGSIKTPENSTPEPDHLVTKNLSDITCTLINKNLNLSLEIRNGDIIGRSSGIHASRLAAFNTISGRHLAFYYDILKGWMVEDLNSSNGTKYSSNNQSWATISKLLPNTRTSVLDGGYLLISNIEFLVQWHNSSSSATQRI